MGVTSLLKEEKSNGSILRLVWPRLECQKRRSVVSHHKQIEITRKQLFDDVWSAPSVKVAMKYGISDVGLAKICKRNNVPKPPLGYWAKLAHGHKVDRPALPKIKNEQPVYFYTVNSRIGKEEPRLLEQTNEMIAFEKLPKNQITVPAELKNPLPLTTEISKELRKAEKNRHGLYCAGGIAVTKPLIPRALLVFDTLLKAMEQRGYLETGIFERVIPFGISEYIQSEPTARAKAKMEKEGSSRRYRDYDYERHPSGRLTLEIHHPFYLVYERIQRNWRDGKTQRVENCLNAFICGLIRWAAVDLERHLRDERKKAEEEKQRREQEESAQHKAMERAKRTKLRADAKDWELANKLRRYIDAVIEKDGPVTPGSDLEKWVAWARAEADIDDPLALD